MTKLRYRPRLSASTTRKLSRRGCYVPTVTRGFLAGRTTTGLLSPATVGRGFFSAAVLAVCFMCGALTVRSPLMGVTLVGVFLCLVVYVVQAHWMVWIALFAAYATLPAGVPKGKLIGGTIIYAYEIFFFLAILYLTLSRRERFPVFVLPWVYLLAVVPTAVTGYVNGHETAWIIAEFRPFVMLAAGFTLAELVIRCGIAALAARVISIILWVSALMVVAASFGLVKLQSGERGLVGADGSGIGEGLRRFFTPTQTPALAILVVLVVVAVQGGFKARDWLLLGSPAAILLFFTFTRYSFAAVLAAFVLASLMSPSQATIVRGTKIVGSALLSIAGLGLLLRIASPAWVGQQFDAWVTRVIGGLTLGSADTSFAARLGENANLWVAIREAPFFGHGLGYPYQAPFGPPDSFSATFGPYYAHNFYLWLLAKAGIVGLLAFVAFVAIPIVTAVRAGTVEARASAVVALVILAVSVVSPAGEDSLGAACLGAALGAALTYGRQPEKSASANQPAVRPTVGSGEAGTAGAAEKRSARLQGSALESSS